MPALPADGMVDKGSELTFTLSANAGYKIKALTIGDATYSDVTDNTITQKVKIEKETAVSAIVEAEASSEPIPGVQITTDSNGTITATGTISLDQISNLAEKAVNGNVIDTKNLTIKSFKSGNNTFTAYTISKTVLKKAAKALSVLNIENADSTKQNITLDENANIKTISGDISLKDIMECSNEETTEIAKYIAYNLEEKTEPDFDSANLKINTFNKKPKENSKNIEWEYISTPITPKFLKETKLNALNKAILNFKDGDVNVPVSFASHQGETEEQKQNDYFDITEFYNEIENGKLKNIKNIPADKVKGNIFLRGERELNIDTNNEDYTNYPNAEELVSLIKKFNNNKIVTVGSVYVAGTLNELLPYLLKINGKPQIEKNYGDIKIVNYYNTKCYKTGYKNGKLPASHLQEYYNRAKHNAMRIMDTTIENLDSTNYTGDFVGDMLTRVNFTGGDLSNISFFSCMTGGGYLKFENTILPKTMEGSVIFDLTLKNSKFPDLNLSLGKTIKALPKIENSLKIYNLKNKLFDQWTKEDIEQFKMKKDGPKEFIGPRYIWEKFPYKKESEYGTPTIFIEDNTTGSIQKPTNTFLALLQNQGRSRG
ncbi:hypothetical protein C5N99_00475 [Treponema medium]|uniref:hypothetical protein n=1 Tax=Treponema medium TaxID=58231 RepID=UPI00197EBFEE|nr:hypothetical protein [Treponema medium]QSH91123.1 hypothetical protein C5N99_00475 [Treponema medium]